MKRISLILGVVVLLISSNAAYASDFYIKTSPDSLSFGPIQPGASGSQFISIEASGSSEDYVFIYKSVSGEIASWVSLGGAEKVWGGNAESVGVKVFVPENAAYGRYSFDVQVQVGSYRKTIPSRVEVPVILTLGPPSVDVTVSEDYGNAVTLKIVNICSRASIYDIQFSADDSISKWLILPSASSLGKGVTGTEDVRVQVPAGESKPVGVYSGNIHARYKYGPRSGISTSMTITVLPSEQWYNKKYGKINSLDDRVIVYRSGKSSPEFIPVTDLKDEMITLLNLTKEDTSRFHELTDPFLDNSIELVDEFATHLVGIFKGWAKGEKSPAAFVSLRKGIDVKIADLQDSTNEETRVGYRDSMHNIHEKLSSIWIVWAKTIDNAMGDTKSTGELEQALGEEALLKAQNATLVSPALEYFTLAYGHFDRALKYYERIADVAKAEGCRQLANTCWKEMQSLNQQMMDIKQRAADMTQAGSRSYLAGQAAESLADSSEHFNQAKIHFRTAAEEYRRIGTPEYDDEAIGLDEKAADSEIKGAGVEPLIKGIREDANSKELSGEDATRKGENAILPFIALAHLNSAKESFNEALNLYIEIGGDTRLEQDKISGQIQEVDEKIQREKKELAIYISVISIVTLIIIALFTKRYLHTMSIRREMGKEGNLFQE
ncbi:hypothetical protein ACFLWS_04045 [Chloroflexota bacterium]